MLRKTTFRQIIVFLFVIFFGFLFITGSCKKDELYSFNRPQFATSLMTQSMYELRTSALKDTLYINNGEGVLSAYFAIIQGEFDHVLDTIKQYGHVWSTTKQFPKINPRDTSTFSRYYNWTFDSSGTFTSNISLYPETKFWVRSYVITSKGDTGYNQQVFSTTSLPPINEWFFQSTVPAINGNVRTGAVAFTFVEPEKNYTVGIVGTGNNASQVLNDFWIFDPETGSWEGLPGVLPQARTDAVGFVIVTLDEFNRKVTNLYVGGGRDMSGNVYSDFYRYSYITNDWHRISDFPRGITGGVAFTSGDKAYVGLGSTQNYDNGGFYQYDPYKEANFEYPWTPCPTFENDPAKHARQGSVCFTIENVSYVGMGMHINESDDTIYYNDLWMFVPNEMFLNESYWVPMEPFPAGGRVNCTAFAMDYQGYVGLGYDGDKICQDLYRFDPFVNTWYQIADYKTGPDYTGQVQKTTRAFGFGIKKIGYVGGGFNGDDQDIPYSNEFWNYRPW